MLRDQVGIETIAQRVAQQVKAITLMNSASPGQTICSGWVQIYCRASLIITPIPPSVR